jgi:hypothetical protein
MMWLRVRLPKESAAGRDEYREKYGGRLPGGGKQGYRSAKDLFGSKDDSDGEPKAVGFLDAVDWDRIGVGKTLEFKYYRGTRAGQGRRVEIRDIKTNEVTGSRRIQCVEENGESRTYWPAYMGDIKYDVEATEPFVGVRGVDCATSTSLQAVDRVTSAVERGRAAMKSPDSWKQVAEDPLPLSTAERSRTVMKTLDLWKQGVGLVRKASPLQIGRNESSAASSSEIRGERRSPETQRGPVLDLSKTFAEHEEAKPEVSFFSGKDMLPMMKEEIDKIEHSFYGMQYVIDHTDCCLLLTVKASQGITGLVLLDRDNFYDSSCARQAARIHELWKQGVQFRLVKPKGSGFACMHAKSWIFDDKVLVTGSCNLTHGGLENNVEHMYKIATIGVIQQLKQSFLSLWETATEVTQAEIDIMISKQEKRELRKRSASLPRARRSPSPEQDQSAKSERS